MELIRELVFIYGTRRRSAIFVLMGADEVFIAFYPKQIISLRCLELNLVPNNAVKKLYVVPFYLIFQQ